MNDRNEDLQLVRLLALEAVGCLEEAWAVYKAGRVRDQLVMHQLLDAATFARRVEERACELLEIRPARDTTPPWQRTRNGHAQN